MKPTAKAALLSLITAMAAAPLHAEESKVDYRPEIHGTIRARAEMSTEAGEYRFQVRNARLSVNGQIARSIDYFINTDFCDCGSIKILDVWVRMKTGGGFSVQAGQFRMPFGVDPFRGPHNYIFANRSFIGKQMCNVRAVGIKASYSHPTMPLTAEAGVFNPTPIGNHTVWNSTVAASGKVSYRVGNVTFTTGIQSVIPDSVRTNLIDGCISWKSGRWLVEGEYMNKHYTRDRHKDCHGYNVYADYHMPINAGVFNRLSFQGRFDGMTAHSSAKRNADKELQTNDPARNRVTLGATISYIRSKNMFLDLRFDYEKYFYHHDCRYSTADGDKALVELILRF